MEIDRGLEEKFPFFFLYTHTQNASPCELKVEGDFLFSLPYPWDPVPLFIEKFNSNLIFMII